MIHRNVKYTQVTIFIGRCMSRAPIALLLVLLLMAVFSNGNLEASQELSTDLTEFSLEELMDMTIYAASKYKQKMSEAPASVSIITSDEIKKYGYRTLADILRSVSGFYITYDRSYHYVGVRGFSRPGDYNTRLLLLINGHRTNDNIFDSAMIGTEFFLDVDLIERIEIIRGPSSSLYGTSAFFAVVNVITKRGRDFSGAEISAEAGSFDAYKGRLSYGRKFENGLETFVSGSLYGTGGQELYFKEFDDPETNYGNTSEDADKDRFKNAFLNILYGDWALQAGYLDRDKYLPTAAWETVFNDPRSKALDKQAFIDVKYESDLGKHLNLMARVSYNFYDGGGDYVCDYAEDGDPPDIYVNKDDSEGQWWLGEVKLSTESIKRNKITFGTEYRLNTRQDQKNYDKGWSDDPYLDDRRDSTIWAFYAQDEIRIHNRILLNAGVRYDHYDTFGGEASPRLGLIYQPFDDTTVKFLYGEAFRAPNVYELYYNDGEESQKASPNLEPEEIATYEVVVEQKLSNNFRTEVSAYHYHIDDLISAQTDPADGLIVFDNADETEANGMELALTGKMDGDIEGRVSYSYCKAEDSKTNDWLSNSPKHMGKLNVTFPLVSKKLFAGLELQYMGERKTLAGNTADDFLITNLTLFLGNLFKGIEASASLYNVFDKTYGDPGSEEHVQDIIEQDGRTFRVKLVFRF